VNIVSYNVNGIRAALNKGLTSWLSTVPCDILCIQETKAHLEQVDLTALEELGFKSVWHSAAKKGYSGVATFFKKEPDYVEIGMGIHKYDEEGRVLRTDFGDITLLNCYFPSGTTGDIRQEFKMDFLSDFHKYANSLRATRPNLIIGGDYNIAHTESDIHDPKGNKNSSGFLPEERTWMTNWLNNGFVDSFRMLHPDKTEYSWWTYRAGARAKNKGWRIDYLTLADHMAGQIAAAGHYNEAMHSDHCPVFLSLRIE